ncbi:MAG: L-aspartate oxidase [Deltaproteobacteria bacterium]|nr:L-aspartate oxidase [Deltaproteobacteria bacterium]
MATDFDFLIIGSGLAGLNAALRIAEAGRSVCLVTKRAINDSATVTAQGGIASVMSEQDSFAAHVADTLTAGIGLCHEDVVRTVVKAGPEAIKRLAQFGVSFDRHENGYDLGREGGHSARRILHSQDISGQAIAFVLAQRAQQISEINILEHHIAVDLITMRKLGNSFSPDRCLGAYVLNNLTGELLTIRARATLLATGGAGKVYLYTSNPDVATGDGIAMAFRAGAALGNMEFVQFHPTCLYHPRAKNFLISEAVRGEGGVLRRRDGQAFMKSVHPLADLAPRDIVARAIDTELKRTGDDYVLLDITARPPSFIKNRFPNLYKACLQYDIDMTKEPIPIVPAAHYFCGGICTNINGATEITGLFAAGEAAFTGLHGANRLASNSLLESFVTSDLAAIAMLQVSELTLPQVEMPDWDPGSAVDPDEMIVVSHNWDELRHAMSSYVGIVRSDKRLVRAAKRIKMIQEEIDDYYWNFKLTHDLVELRNIAVVANIVVASAKHRRESRGLHYNIDTPEKNDNYLHDTICRRGLDQSLIFA